MKKFFAGSWLAIGWIIFLMMAFANWSAWLLMGWLVVGFIGTCRK